jgi:hypothetical protein
MGAGDDWDAEEERCKPGVEAKRPGARAYQSWKTLVGVGLIAGGTR